MGETLAVHPRGAGRRRGAVLVEFALIAFAFYLLLAGTIEIGRMIMTSQLLNNAARVGARELAVMPLPATMSFDEALHDPDVRETIYDRGLLALNVSGMTPAQVRAEIDGWPVLNRMLSALMVREEINGEEYLRYPGALVANPAPDPFNPNPFYVAIPQVVSRDAQGHETIEWREVVEEVRPSDDPLEAPFSVASTGAAALKGVVALRINYPFQAATMSAYLETPPAGGALNTPVEASDGSVVDTQGVATFDHTSDQPSMSGKYGLGKLYALGKEVRPYRRLISAQAISRRERLGR